MPQHCAPKRHTHARAQSCTSHDTRDLVKFFLEFSCPRGREVLADWSAKRVLQSAAGPSRAPEVLAHQLLERKGDRGSPKRSDDLQTDGIPAPRDCPPVVPRFIRFRRKHDVDHVER